MGHLKRLVMHLQLRFLIRREPVVEALFIEGVGFGIDALVVDGILTRRQDAVHLERQPAAGTGTVVDEDAVVARAAERGEVLAVFRETLEGRTLVDGFLFTNCVNFPSRDGRLEPR